MSHAEKLRALIEEIAKEKNYNHCTITLEPLSSGGANYSSHLFLSTLSAPGKDDIHMFAKIAAIGKEMRQVIPSLAFTAEHYFYSELVSVYRQIEEKYNIKDEDKLITATFYGASDEYMYESLILENLTKRGFQSFDRFKSVDWSYAAFSIKQLALFHALSIAFAKEDPKGYEDYVTTRLLPTEYYENMSSFLQVDVEKTLNSVHEKNRERVAKFLETPDLRKPILRLLSAKGPVFVHSDYRPSNMMHKLRSDGTTEVIVLDYQGLHKGSPAVDLLYFLFLSTDKKFRDQYLKRSFEYYYDELASALKRFNLNAENYYTKKTYDKDLKEMMPYMLSMSFNLLLVITIDEAQGQVTENMDILKSDLTANELYVERINDWVDDCIDMGVL